MHDAVVEATLEYLPKVVADLVRFQRLTGCRPGEALQLRPCDVDRTTDVWIFRPNSHKTEHHGRERLVMIGRRAQGLLLKFLARDPANNINNAAIGSKAHPEIWANRLFGNNLMNETPDTPTIIAVRT